MLEVTKCEIIKPHKNTKSRYLNRTIFWSHQNNKILLSIIYGQIKQKKICLHVGLVSENFNLIFSFCKLKKNIHVLFTIHKL